MARLGLLLAVAAAASVLDASSAAFLQLPSWFGDNMVLQTNSEYGARAFINGLASPHAVVTVACGGRGAQFLATADASGAWEVELLGRGSCDNITVSTPGAESVSATGVQFGEVFFCSGQSNMVFPMSLTLNSSAEIATAADWPNFRFFQTPLQYNDTEQFTTKGGNWSFGTPDVVSQFSAVCYMTVRDMMMIHGGFPKNKAVGLVQSAWGGTRVEAWMSPDALAQCKQFPVPPAHANAPQNNESWLFNAMYAPFQKMSIRAALWYQGEANADQKTLGLDNEDFHTAAYACKLQAMVADWRLRKGMGDFAFLNVQLPPSIAPADSAKDPDTGRPAIRAAAAEAVSRPGGQTDIAGMAVTVDLGGKSAWGFDHPVDKNDISHRLALQGVHVAYAKQLDSMPQWTGPQPTSINLTAADGRRGARGAVAPSVRVTLDPATASGLALRDVKDCTACCKGQSPFEASADYVKWAPVAPTLAADAMTLAVPAGTKHVRYAWHDFVECVLVNDAGLPMGPWKRNLTAAAEAGAAAAAAATQSDGGSDDVVGASASVAPPPGSGPIQSPPLGFNSWNFYHCNIDENEIKAIALAMVNNGMKEAGYRYINIDDCWQVGRDNKTGAIIADPARFPSGMKALTDFVHAQGLKFGVYTARGSRTCQNRPGAYQHELIDAATYCDWGLDYLKNDNCGGTNWPAENTSWILFKQGFDKCYNETGRYVVKSIEYCRDPDSCGQWIGGVANLWRTEGDIQNTWQSVYGNIHGQNDMAPVARPGAFNDPDMLQVGNVGLTLTEQRTHFAYWCIASAPLLAGTDIVHASNETLEILTAPEYLAVNQDLGAGGRIQGVLLQANASDGGGGGVSAGAPPGPEVWVKRLADNKTVAALLVNAGDDAAADVTVTWKDLGIPDGATATVRDLWQRKDIGEYSKLFTAKAVAPHDHVFVTVTPS